MDENDNVLDGRHRLKIDPNAPKKVIRGLSDAEKEAFVFRCNFVRRNLSPDQKREARVRMRETARKLREEDAKKWTQKRVAESLGVARSTVSEWFTESATNAGTGNGSQTTTRAPAAPKPAPTKPDARVKVSAPAKAKVAEQVKAGKTHEQVAADLGVARPRTAA